MNIDPGELNKKIQIIQIMDGESYDDEGLPIRDEKTVRTCWARVTNSSGTELVRAGSEFAEAKKRFLVRYAPAPITTAMVVRYQSEADGQPADHRILYINPYGDSREYLEIWTELERRET